MTKNARKNVARATQRGPKGANRTTERMPRAIGILSSGGAVCTGFPNTLLTKVRYYDTYAMTVTTGSLGKQVMRWNSTFDPDFTSTGHQPLYRDTLAAIYDHYAVVSAKANVQIVNTSTVPLIVGCATDDDSAAAGSVSVLCEQVSGQHKLLPPLSGSLSSVAFNPTWDCEKVLGINPYSSEEYKTAVGSNPTEESYLHIWGTVTDGSSSTTITVAIEMVYEVLWSELATPSSS